MIEKTITWNVVDWLVFGLELDQSTLIPRYRCPLDRSTSCRDTYIWCW